MVEECYIIEYSLLSPEKVAMLYANDSYKAMVLEYIEGKHIIEYGLLPPTRFSPAHINRKIPAPITSTESSSTESTEIVTIEDASDLPAIYPLTLLTEEGTAAFTAAYFPQPQPDYDADGYDWTATLSTYDFLGIEEKHTTACARIPWKAPDYLQEVKGEMEAFTAWEDRRRAMELPSSPVAATTQENQEVHLLDDRPRRQFQEDAVFVTASIGEKWPLDGVLEGVKGLCDMVAG